MCRTGADAENRSLTQALETVVQSYINAVVVIKKI